MKLPRPLPCAVLLLALPLGAAATEAESLFVRRVWPLLQEKCLACPGKDEAKIKGGLDLRTLAETLAGGDSGKPAFVAGRPEQSPLYLAITRTHADWEPMPPKENDQLTAEQTAYVRDWITAGAPWPDAARTQELLAQKDKWSADDGIVVPTSGGLSDDWTQRRYKPENLWAYQPLRKPTAPAAREVTHPVDAFLAARLPAGLPPAPAADARTFIRRATFDLLGLPPTPEEVAAFEVEHRRNPDAAVRALVDRLLASPHYGEQWGRHWLDVARYADTSGFANDFARGSAWRYRDYVVRAFNADKPFDRFIREQIAGDEIAPDDPEAIVATGFLRMGAWELTGMEVPKIARQRFLDDVTDGVGQAFLGHMLQCARCHDHKFDPVPTRDYYAFQAAFATTQLSERKADFLPVENTSGFEEKKYLLQRESHYRAELKRIDAISMAAARAWYVEKKLDPAVFEQVTEEIVAKTNPRGREAGYTEIRAALQRRKLPEDQIPPRHAGLSEEDLGKERIARKGLERIRWELDRYEPMALSVYAGRTPDVKAVLAPTRMPAARMTIGELEQTHILTGGDPFANGAPVKPAVLSAPTAVGRMSTPPTVPAEIEGRRRAIADWIASPDNPLTARVTVNRVWLWHFGTALAGNPNNVGATGKKPTHPELLDWLAATFVEQGWSVKALHRLIMTSAAYRRASTHPEPRLLAEKDPAGTSYAAFKPRRLAAEEFRDAMLRVTGELNPALGGIPVRPEINREAAFQPRQVMGTFAEAWQPSPLPAQRHRRTLYALKIRGQPDPFMEVFNAPSPDLSCEARDASTVTPQAFSLFNSEATLARATAWAARLTRETSTREQTIARAYALAFGRAPSAAEAKASLAHWDAMTARHRTTTIAKPAVAREVLREAVEENTGTTFIFKEPLEIAADFVPDLHVSDLPPETRGLAELCLVLLNTNEFAYIY
ncbi:MAG: PSD1 domain-containing protein [Opitutaceae bacterium]|nr:PSD1 domain-containing protein [Opitutaceae bacterium]